ncbi:DUF1189 family protein [Anaerobacillus sp. CMMVII]|nr:DUF1189 family protein [Anaerobacillus sp. CMMVII]
METEAVFISDGVAESFRYRDLGNINMTKQEIEEFTDTIIELLPLIIAIIVFLLFIVLTTLKYIGIFVLTLFGLIIKRNTGITLSYKQVWVLSAYAVTLPTVFFAIIDGLNITIPFAFTLYWVVAVIMLYLIFKEIPQSQVKKEETADDLDRY